MGATEQLAEWLAEYRNDLSFPQQVGEIADINVAHCPERVLPGKVVTELVQNDRVIGGMTKRCSERSVELYKTFVMGECVITNARTAEMAKLTENSSRDVQIAFANELSMICDELDIDVWELIALANRHPRVNILQPGPGVGGHCIAVDPWFIVSKTPKQAKIIHTARKVNDHKPDWVIEKVKIAIADFLQANPNKTAKDVTIACYGLAFKPDIDDLRESPALSIARAIAIQHSSEVLAIEPNIKTLNEENMRLVTIDESLSKTDIHVMLVDHQQFKKIKLNDAFVIDTKGIW